MVIAQFILQKNDQEGNQKHMINFSWPELVINNTFSLLSVCKKVMSHPPMLVMLSEANNKSLYRGCSKVLLGSILPG